MQQQQQGTLMADLMGVIQSKSNIGGKSSPTIASMTKGEVSFRLDEEEERVQKARIFLTGY